MSVTRDGDFVTVQCSSTHLTSFAVLVDVGGAQVHTCTCSIVNQTMHTHTHAYIHMCMLRWPIGVMFAAHCTIAPLHKPATPQTCHFTNRPLHKPATSQTDRFQILHYWLSLCSHMGLATACYDCMMIVYYMHGAHTYTGQMTRLCTTQEFK